MPVYLVVTDESFSLDKIKRKFPADFVGVFSNTFLLSYELSDWQLNDEIAELIYEEHHHFEIVITKVDKADLFHFKDADKYVKYLFDRRQK
jgi:hypothetical protein